MPGGEYNSNIETALALLTSQIATLAVNVTRMEGRLEKAAIDAEQREQRKLDSIDKKLDEQDKCISGLEKGAAARQEKLKIVLEEVERLRASETWWKIGLAVAIIIGTILGIYK